MSSPKPDKNGKRWYSKWIREDVSCCIATVTPNERGGFARSHQCTRKRGHGPDGLYCKQHDPAAVSRREAELRRRYDEKMNRRMRPVHQMETFRSALEKIASGHNDPRAVAIEALRTD
jgi:hypothetical protein